MSWASTFSSWGWADIIATSLVVLGVVGETWSFLMKMPFNPTAFSELEAKKKKVEKWSLVILLIGVAIEVPATAENLKDAANERLMADSLEAKMQPRTISMQQIKDFIFLTKDFPKFPIRVEVIGMDAETSGLAWQIREMLNQAGFPTPDSDTNLYLGIYFIPFSVTTIMPGQHPGGIPADVQFIYDETDNPLSAYYYSEEKTNGYTRFYFDESNTNDAYGVLMSYFQQIGINTMPSHYPPWAGPNHCAICVNPKLP